MIILQGQNGMKVETWNGDAASVHCSIGLSPMLTFFFLFLPVKSALSFHCWAGEIRGQVGCLCVNSLRRISAIRILRRQILVLLKLANLPYRYEKKEVVCANCPLLCVKFPFQLFIYYQYFPLKVPNLYILSFDP